MDEERYEQIGLFDSELLEKKITKPVRLISFFSGIEAQYKALSFLGKALHVSVESYKTCEWAYNSIIACNAIHNRDFTDYSVGKSKEEMLAKIRGISINYNVPLTDEQLDKKPITWIKNAYNNCIANHNLLNIMNVKGKDLEINDTDKYEYILTYSFPCITKDSLILTEKGYIPFEQVKVGDKVLTKSNTWQKVAKIFDNGIHQTGYLNAMGLENIHCTPNHKFYVREMFRKGKPQKRYFKEPTFKEAKDLTRKDYLGIPVIQDEVPFYTKDLDFWFMLGMYLGDGWLPKPSNNAREIIIACNEKKLDILKEKLPYEKYKYTYSWNGTCYRFRFPNKEIRTFIEKHIGTGCESKKISLEILKLPKEQLLAFYEGYLNSDGCILKKRFNIRQFNSINKGLIYSFSLIINKLFQRPTSIYKVKVKPTKNLQGRIINQKDWYQLRFNILNKKQDKAFYENGYIWYPFKSYVLDKEEHVYNMEVENDHSYILQGCISKNCQDLSLAGKRAGMSTSQKDGGTRSGLLWEVERILTELHTHNRVSMPQILLMENVPQIHSEKDMPHFIKWMERLEQLGYSNYYKDLNAKDFGIPQNRERTFMISLLRSENGEEYNYKFPLPFKREVILKDMLENNVPEKYYLSSRMLDYLTGVNQKKSKYNRGEVFERNFDPNKDCASTITTAAGQRPTDNFIPEEKSTDDVLFEFSTNGHQSGNVYNSNGIAPTLTACDYKSPVKIVENQKQEGIPIVEATEKGYKVAQIGDGVDIGSRMQTHRGTVQNGMAQTLKTTCEVGVVVEEETLFSETEKALLTKDGNIKRYLGSDIVDKFEEGQMATTTYPNGYGHGPRTHNESIALNTIDRPIVKQNLRIRKLTPKECLRLMAFQDKDADHMVEVGLSNQALYHCAGDSICVNVLIGIFSKLFGLDNNETDEVIKSYIKTIKEED